ncbi:MAG: recombinase family protein [Chloroflexi bacterium]|nr:recombinase family protein [Chloroflexota bacterium]
MSAATDDELPAEASRRLLAAIRTAVDGGIGAEYGAGFRAPVRPSGSSQLPLGYTAVRSSAGSRGNRQILVDRESGPLVTWAFETYASGTETLFDMLAGLTERGLKRSSEGRSAPQALTPSALTRLLRNPFYLGLSTSRTSGRPVRHPALVDPETFDRVQRRLDNEVGSGARHHLDGVLWCARCGGRLRVRRRGQRAMPPEVACSTATCELHPVRANLVDILIAEHLADFAIAPSLRAAVGDALGDCEAVGNLRAAYLAATPSVRREYLRTLFERISFSDDGHITSRPHNPPVVVTGLRELPVARAAADASQDAEVAEAYDVVDSANRRHLVSVAAAARAVARDAGDTRSAAAMSEGESAVRNGTQLAELGGPLDGARVASKVPFAGPDRAMTLDTLDVPAAPRRSATRPDVPLPPQIALPASRPPRWTRVRRPNPLIAISGLVVAWAGVVLLSSLVAPGPGIVRIALFGHLAALVVGFGAVLFVDWHGLLFLARRRSHRDVVAVACSAHPLIWLGVAGLAATGVFLRPNLSAPLTWVKLGLVLVLAANGMVAAALSGRLRELGDRLPSTRLLMIGGVVAAISQAAWWGSTLIGFINATS